ncbi:MAG: hypothetical protein ACRDS9_15240 [Pseudonocardiaceae bacterium]
MLKWILAAIGFLAAIAAVFAGVVIFLFNREGPDTSNLTELHRATVLEQTDTGSAYRVVYEYEIKGQTYFGKETISSKRMSDGSTFFICLDPSDPVQHSLTYTDCGPEGPVHLQEGLEEKPEL